MMEPPAELGSTIASAALNVNRSNTASFQSRVVKEVISEINQKFYHQIFLHKVEEMSEKLFPILVQCSTDKG